MSKLKGRFALVIVFSLIAWASATLFAKHTRKVDATSTVTIPSAAMDEADRAWDAAEILRDRANPLLIPKGLFEGANAIVVIPSYSYSSWKRLVNFLAPVQPAWVRPTVQTAQRT